MSAGSTLAKVVMILLGTMMLLGGGCIAVLGLSVGVGDWNVATIAGGLLAVGVAVLGVMIIAKASKQR